MFEHLNIFNGTARFIYMYTVKFVGFDETNRTILYVIEAIKKILVE